MKLILLVALLSSPVYADDVARREIIHLKELIQAADKRYEQRFDAQERAVSAALSAQEKSGAAALAAAKEAVTKAETANEKRLDSVNEFRSQLKDQAGTFITRSELWGYLIGAGGLFIAVYGLAMKKKNSTR